MDGERFADGRYVAILGESSNSRRYVPEIVDWLGNEFGDDVGEVIWNRGMSGKVVDNYKSEYPSKFFHDLFGERSLSLWPLACDWSESMSRGDDAWVCPRIVVADITKDLRFDGRIDSIKVSERWNGFHSYFGKD